MRQVCYVCRVQYGEKEPLDDNSETSGLCPRCYPKEIEKLERWMKEREDKKWKSS